MQHLKSWLIGLVSLMLVTGCTGNDFQMPGLYGNPYDRPEVQADYQGWVEEVSDAQWRAEIRRQFENPWTQPAEFREPVYHDYLTYQKATQRRLRTISDKERQIRLQDFQSLTGIFVTSIDSTQRKGVNVIQKKTLRDSRRRQADEMRFGEFLVVQEELSEFQPEDETTFNDRLARKFDKYLEGQNEREERLPKEEQKLNRFSRGRFEEFLDHQEDKVRRQPTEEVKIQRFQKNRFDQFLDQQDYKSKKAPQDNRRRQRVQTDRYDEFLSRLPKRK